MAKNLIGFITDGGTEYLGTTMSFPVGSWGKETITFELESETEGEFSLGYTATNSGSGSMPHFYLDGISLFYEGELQFDPSLFALQGTVNDAENYAYQLFNSTLKADFEDAISEARSLISSQSSDADANKAAQEKITAMLQEVLASIADYERLQKFYDEVLVPSEDKYAAQPDIKDRILILDEEIYDALQTRLLSTRRSPACPTSSRKRLRRLGMPLSHPAHSSPKTSTSLPSSTPSATPTAPLHSREATCPTSSGSMVQPATSRHSMARLKYGTRVPSPSARP